MDNGGAAGATAELEDVHVRCEVGLGFGQFGAVGLLVADRLGGIAVRHPVPKGAWLGHSLTPRPQEYWQQDNRGLKKTKLQNLAQELYVNA